MEKLAYNMKEVAEVLGISKSLAYEMAKKENSRSFEWETEF